MGRYRRSAACPSPGQSCAPRSKPGQAGSALGFVASQPLRSFSTFGWDSGQAKMRHTTRKPQAYSEGRAARVLVASTRLPCACQLSPHHAPRRARVVVLRQCGGDSDVSTAFKLAIAARTSGPWVTGPHRTVWIEAELPGRGLDLFSIRGEKRELVSQSLSRLDSRATNRSPSAHFMPRT